MNEVYNGHLWDSLRKKSRLIETDMNSLERKRTGSHYTNLDLTDVMMDELVCLVRKGRKICDCRFLKPCVGTGNFVFSYLKAVKAINLSVEDAEMLIDNLYVADINKNALEAYKASLTEVVYDYWQIKLSEEYFEKF